MPTKDRVPVPVQLSPKQDTDLIEWINSIPLGGREQAVKTALRVGLGRKVGAGVQRQSAPSNARLDALESELRQKLAWIDQTMAYLSERVENLSSNAIITSNAPPNSRKRSGKQMARRRPAERRAHFLSLKIADGY